MIATSTYIITKIDKLVGEFDIRPARVITSSREFSGWLSERWRYNYQILLNGIKAPAGQMQHRVSTAKLQIKKEFNGVLDVDVLPFPVDTMEIDMVVEEIAMRYDCKLDPNEVIQINNG
jgi:hypothetical protein